MAASKAKAKAKKAPSKEVALKKNTLPAGINMGADVGKGMEGADKDAYAIPFLTIVQKMSPQVDEDDPKYIEGAKPGMLLNTVTNELFDGKDTGVHFIPCAFQRRFLRWGPRDAGGGFKGEVLPEEASQLQQNEEVQNISGRLYFPDEKGNVDEKACDYLSDTRNHFGLLITPSGDVQQVLLSLASTQIKKSKQLMTLLDSVKLEGDNGKVTPPTWANKVLLKTIGESNDKGSWAGLRVELDGFVDSQDLYDAGKSFHDLIARGSYEVNYDVAAEVEGAAKEGF